MPGKEELGDKALVLPILQPEGLHVETFVPEFQDLIQGKSSVAVIC